MDKDTALKYECYETPEWAARAILEKELLTYHVWDPCTGRGVLAKAAASSGHVVKASDVHDWGYGQTHDFLEDHLTYVWGFDPEITTIFMNPPFSRAVDFVEKAHEIGVRKIVCFQRLSWFESRRRKTFWDKHPPARIWVCGDRATCWRVDIPEEQRVNGTTTAHAWFVWEKGQNNTMPALGRLYRGDAA